MAAIRAAQSVAIAQEKLASFVQSSAGLECFIAAQQEQANRITSLMQSSAGLAAFVEQHRQTIVPALAQLAAFAEKHQQMAEFGTPESQQVASAPVDFTLPSWVVQICVFVLLLEMWFIGWSLAAAVGPEARAKYAEITGMIMTAIPLIGMINFKRGGNLS